MTVLLVSSTGAEFSGLTRRFAAQRLQWPIDFAARIEVDGAEWILAANGAGTGLACEAFRAASERTVVHALVSTGYCGALDPEIQPAEIVVATQILAGGNSFEATATNKPARFGAAAGSDRVVASSHDKRQLRLTTGAATVDMESHGLARLAAKAGIPFYCIRAVTDTATEDMHLDFNAARDAAGRIQTGRLLAESLRRPMTALPELCRLAFRAHRASQNLGEFLADCRF